MEMFLSTHHAFSVIHPWQILFKLLANMEIHVVVLKGTEGLDDYVVTILIDVFVRLQQGGNFPNGNIYICVMDVYPRKGEREFNTNDQ